MTKTNFQCIGDEMRGYFVEPKWPNGRMWIVPGTSLEDPAARANGAIERAQDYVRRWWPESTFKVAA
jgi:hypothetical protein